MPARAARARSGVTRHAPQRGLERGRVLLFTVLLLVLPPAPSSAQDPSAVDSGGLPAASIVDGWGRGLGLKDGTVGAHSRASFAHAARGEDSAFQLPLDSAWARPSPSSLRAPDQETVDSRVKDVLQTAATMHLGPKYYSTGSASSDVRGRGGERPSATTQEKSADATTYIVTKNGRVYLSEKPVNVPVVSAKKSHAQKMMGMAHAKMNAIAKKDKRFADELSTEAKQLKAAGMAAEGKALEREAQDLLSKLQSMIKNKHKAEQDKASINQRVAEVDKRLSNMKLHGSIVPHRKDIDELRDTSKKEVRKDVKHQDTSIYEYRNGTVWWSRETNSTILNATAGLGAAQATAPPATPHHKRSRFINRPDSVVMNSRRHRAAAASSHADQTAAAAAGPGARAGSLKAGAAHSNRAPAAQSSAGQTDSKAHVESGAPTASKKTSRTDGAWAPGTVLRGLEVARGARPTQPAAPKARAGAVSVAAASGALSITRVSDSRGGALGSRGASEGRAIARTSSEEGDNSGVQGAVHRLQARETALRGPDGVHSEGPLYLDIVAVLVVLIVAAVYIRRVFFHAPKVSEAVPVYSPLENG